MRTAIGQVEDAVDLLKHLPPQIWLLYLAGAAPMALTVLWFARQMLSGYLAERCLPEAFLCALVFLFASFVRARFARALASEIEESEANKNRAAECTLVQGCLQAVKLVVLPLAAVSVLPLPWVSAVFRNVSELANEKGATLGGTLRQAAVQASWNARAMTGAFVLCSAAGLVMFVNVFVMALLLPYVLKSMTGWETEWTRTAGAWANGNLFRVTLAVTWLLLDPLLQACAAVRNFEYRAKTDGRDLLVRLRRLAAAAVVLLCVLGGSGRPAVAVQAGEAITAQEMTRAVEQSKKGEEYAWLRPRDATGEPDWFVARLARDARRFFATVRGAFRRLGAWVEGLFAPRKSEFDPEKPGAESSAFATKLMVYVLGALIVLASIVFFARTRKNSDLARLDAQEGQISSGHVDVAADLTGGERDEEEWFKAAREHAGRGEWRLALRAMYLANLAYLGAQQMITIGRSKTNGIYERELRSRCRIVSVREAFTRTNREYERVWYGTHAATPEMHASFELDVRAVRSLE